MGCGIRVYTEQPMAHSRGSVTRVPCHPLSRIHQSDSEADLVASGSYLASPQDQFSASMWESFPSWTLQCPLLIQFGFLFCILVSPPAKEGLRVTSELRL